MVYPCTNAYSDHLVRSIPYRRTNRFSTGGFEEALGLRDRRRVAVRTEDEHNNIKCRNVWHTSGRVREAKNKWGK